MKRRFLCSTRLLCKAGYVYSLNRGLNQRTPEVSLFKPRQRNLWVADTFEWRQDPQLAQPANPMPDSAAFSFLLFVASCLSNQFALPGKRYGVREEQHSLRWRITQPGPATRTEPTAAPRDSATRWPYPRLRNRKGAD